MAVVARGEYVGVAKDTVDRFHGNQIVYFGWDMHLMFYAPVCLCLSPKMSFGDVVEKVLPGCWGTHPDFLKIDWSKAQWLKSGQAFVPDFDRSLADNGIDHKTIVRLRTPGLDGLAGAGF